MAQPVVGAEYAFGTPQGWKFLLYMGVVEPPLSGGEDVVPQWLFERGLLGPRDVADLEDQAALVQDLTAHMSKDDALELCNRCLIYSGAQ